MDTTRANLSLDSWILGHAKRMAKEQGKSLGEFTSEALKWHIARFESTNRVPLSEAQRAERVAGEEAEEAEFYADLDHKGTRGAA
jgi:hypothetical protein